MKHLDPGERLTLIETDDEPAPPHLTVCARCHADVAEARAALRDARSVDVPEPSPLFWDSLSRRVSEEIVLAGRPQARSRWPFWRALIPLTVGVGALLVAVAVDRGSRAVPGVPAPPAVTVEPGSAGPSVEADDEQWTLLANLAADFDVETLSDSLGRSAASGADIAVWQLDEQERVELAVLLRAELQQEP
jgi:hypothetical protein